MRHIVCLKNFDLILKPYRKKRHGRAHIEEDDDETGPSLEEPKRKKKFISKAFVSSSDSSDEEKPTTESEVRSNYWV